LAFFLRLGLSLPRTERIAGAWTAFLGQLTVHAFCRLQGLAPSESPLRASNPFKFARRPIPSWASVLPKVSPPVWPEDFHPLRSRASSAARFDDFPLAGSTAAPSTGRTSASLATPAAPVSRETWLPFRGFPPSDSHPCEVTRSWLTGLRRSPRVPGGVTTPCGLSSNRRGPCLAAG